MEIRMNTEVSLAEAEQAILAFGNENASHLVGEDRKSTRLNSSH